MDSWIFKTARRVCIIAFGVDIFIHACVGASMINGVVKGTASMLIMLVLLGILSESDVRHRVWKSRKKRQQEEDDKNCAREDTKDEL